MNWHQPSIFAKKSEHSKELGFKHIGTYRPVFVKESERLFQLRPHRLRIGVLDGQLVNWSFRECFF